LICFSLLRFDDLTLLFLQLTAGTQKYIWAEAGKLDPLIVDVVLDELIRAATDGGAGSSRCETIGLLLASMTSISVRGKLIFKLRKVRRFCSYGGCSDSPASL
jgi:neurofibromin 1